MKLKFLSISIVILLLVGLISCKEEEEGISLEEQLAIDIELIDAYLEDNEIDYEIHPSGIRYQTIRVGSGNTPTVNNTVTVKYTGYFVDNEAVFDENSSGATFPLAALIPAWQIMIPTMSTGGMIVIYAPSGYCYGTRGTSNIPPNSNLVFEIELIDVR